MQRNRHLLICLAVLASPALRADVALRYETKTTLNPGLPPQIGEAMMKGLSISLPDKAVQQFHNGKIYYSQGKLNLIVDPAKHEITIVDVAGKRYARVTADQYESALTGAVPALPEQAKAALAAVKIHADPAPGDGTSTIQGMQADDHALTISIDGPGAAGMPAGPMVKMNMHLWIAKGSESLRVEALREVAGYKLMSMEALSPVASVQKMFQVFPGLGDAFAAMQKQLAAADSSVMLRTRLDMYIPMLAGLSAQAGAQNPLAGVDPNTPFAQFTEELTQISTAPIADSVFQVPADYRQATVAEVLQSVAGNPAAPVKPASAAAPAANSVISPIRVGAAVIQATLLSQPKPVYPPDAKAARVEGTVRFDAMIGTDGTVKSLQLISGPPLLVQSAMDAVKQWVYKPTLLNDQPVEVKTTIDVSFTLNGPPADKPVQQ